MADKRSIQRELSQNLESYTSNQLLNNLTPAGRTRTSKRFAKDDTSISSSLKRATSSNSGSRRVTPRKSNINGKIHNDSNIVTSPVKTLRRYDEESSDEYDSTTTFDQLAGQVSNDKSAVVPLNDLPRSPLRKGTPKKTKLSSKTPEKEKDNSDMIFDVWKSRSFNGAASSRILDLDGSDNASDDGFNGGRANETIIDEIPADLLSPEKHQYPTENLTKESLNSTPVKSAVNNLTKSTLYPVLSTATDIQKGTHKSNSPSAPTAKMPTPKSKTPEHPLVTKKSSILSPKVSVTTHVISSSIQRPIGRSTSKPSSKQTSVTSTPISAANATSAGKKLTDLTSIPHGDYPLFKGTSRPPSASKIPIYTQGISNPFKEHNPILDVRSPPKRVTQINGTERKYDGNTYGGDNEPRSTISKYDSDEELDVPELTSTKFGILLDANEIRRKRSEIEIYNDEQELVVNKKQKLYPEISNMKKNPIDQPQVPSAQEQRSPVVKPTLAKDTSRSSLYPSLERYYSKSGNTSEKGRDLKESQEERRQSSHATQSEELGDADNWTKTQWKLFLKTYKKYKKSKQDMGVFTSDIMKTLRCDNREIKLKIGFADQYNDELKSGLKKAY